MIVSHDARVLFVHVQKTGGLTVQSLLREGLPDAEPVKGVEGGRHARLDDTLEAHPELADYRIFGFVRNPWARMYSWHAMVLRRHKVAASGNKRVARKLRVNDFWAGVGEQFPDFESFVLRGPDEFERLRTPQIEYLRTPTRRVDFIGRTETFAEDLRRIMSALEVPLPEDLPHRNAGPPRDYREHYTPEMQDRVAELFAPDIAEFGYEF